MMMIEIERNRQAFRVRPFDPAPWKRPPRFPRKRTSAAACTPWRGDASPLGASRANVGAKKILSNVFASSIRVALAFRGRARSARAAWVPDRPPRTPRGNEAADLARESSPARSDLSGAPTPPHVFTDASAAWRLFITAAIGIAAAPAPRSSLMTNALGFEPPRSDDRDRRRAPRPSPRTPATPEITVATKHRIRLVSRNLKRASTRRTSVHPDEDAVNNQQR